MGISFALTLLAGCCNKSNNTQAQAPVVETPADAVEALKAGNKRFVEGHSNHYHSDMSYVKQLDTLGQKPFATVVTCSDSRVPVELLFDQGFGDVFVIRTPRCPLTATKLCR